MRLRIYGSWGTATVLLVATLGGCTAVGRTSASLTGSKYADAGAGLTWNIPGPDLEPPADTRVYLTVRNVSGSDIDVRSALRSGISKLGYKVVRDRNAPYRMKVRVRYFGENDAADGGHATAARLGIVAGAAAGIGTGAAIYEATGSGLGSYGGGAIIGSLAAESFKNAMTPTEWDLVADVVLEERQARPTKVVIWEGQERESSTGSGSTIEHDRTQYQHVGGGVTGRGGRRRKVEKSSWYMPYGVRVTAWARQVRMTEQEAIPTIMKKFAAAPAGLLP